MVGFDKLLTDTSTGDTFDRVGLTKDFIQGSCIELTLCQVDTLAGTCIELWTKQIKQCPLVLSPELLLVIPTVLYVGWVLEGIAYWVVINIFL